jgi:copper chaperone
VETRTIVVSGMTCEHCGNAVRGEVGKLPGVTEVDVDLAAGTVRIGGEHMPATACCARPSKRPGTSSRASRATFH